MRADAVPGSGVGTVCVVGSINLDIVVALDRLPLRGETVLGEEVGRFPGGKGFNQAVAAARSGAAVRFCSRVGADSEGASLVEAAVAVGIDHRFLGIDAERSTGVAQVAALPDSGNAIIVAQGANAALTPAQAVAAVEAEPTAVVLVQLEIPAATALAALVAGRRSGALTVLNAAPAANAGAELFAATDVLVVNETEAEELGGEAVLLASGPTSVIVTLGGDGARWLQRGGEVTVVPAFRVETVDTTGAGDAFCGALAASLADGRSMPEAIRRASAAGAIVAQELGAQGVALGLDTLDALLSPV